MVQAAAQAQAVVAAAKSRGDGLTPMTAAQIAALSQIQAQAIVNARPQTALLASGTPTVDKDGNQVHPTPEQVQHQISIQAQALIHAHTQAQISLGIYKGDSTTGALNQLSTNTTTAINTNSSSTGANATPLLKLTPDDSSQLSPTQIIQQNQIVGRYNAQREATLKRHGSEIATQKAQYQQINGVSTPTSEILQAHESQLRSIYTRHTAELNQLKKTFEKELADLLASFSKQGKATDQGVSKNPTKKAMEKPTKLSYAAESKALSLPFIPDSSAQIMDADGEGAGPKLPPTCSEFLDKLNKELNTFWLDQLRQMRDLGTDMTLTEHHFKNHNDLPLARIKRIMKSDEDVRMISAEAPVLFAKACEMFILDITLRSWCYSDNNRRKTLQKEDVKEAIQRTDVFDFLVDAIN